MKNFVKPLKAAIALATVATPLLAAQPALGAAGYTWTNETTGTPASGQQWRNIVSSTSGQHMAAVSWNGDVYTSANYGATWSDSTSATPLSGTQMMALGSSSTGQYLATANINGDIFTSADYGATWTDRPNAGIHSWTSVAVSSSGQYMTFTDDIGRIFNSSDYGATWTNVSPSSHPWQHVATSASGKYQAATVVGGDVWTSADYGVTWTDQPNSGAHTWKAISSSWTGQYLVAADQLSYVFTSSDYGVHWTQQTNAGSRQWFSVASSASGQYLAAAEAGGDVWTSADYGSTWTGQIAVGSFDAYLGFNASGQYLAMAEDAGDISIANNPSYAASAPAITPKSTNVTVNGSITVDVLSGVSGSPDPSTLAITAGPAHGTAVDPPGTITYTPNAGYLGPDSLTYSVCSSQDPTLCSSAVLSFEVVPAAPGTGLIATPTSRAGLLGFGLVTLFGAVILIPRRRRA